MVIMNPPFSSNVKRNRKFDEQTVKKMQAHELALKKELSHKDPNAGETIDVNGGSTFFTALADKILDKRNGTLAMVLPVTSCVSASGFAVRKLLADRFYIERIVTTHDPKHVNFSYNTGIHECLIVARRYDTGRVGGGKWSTVCQPNIAAIATTNRVCISA